MQLAKIRRKPQPVKNFFYEIWKIAVDLGEFGAWRPGRCGARAVGADARRGARWGARGGRWAARPGAVRRERWAAGRRGAAGRVRGARRAAGRGCEATGRVAAARARGAGTARGAGRALPGTSAARARRAGLRDGHGERDCGTGTASGTAGRARRDGCCRVQARLGARGRRDSERNAARGARAGRKTTHLRRTPATNRPKLALSTIRTASRMKAMRSGRLCALPPPNSTNRKPNRHRRRPILCILIRFAESQNANRTTLMRVRRKGDRIAARTTIHEGGGDDTRERGRCTRTIHEDGGDAGAEHNEAAAQGRNVAPKFLERSADQTRIAQTPRRRTQPNRNNSVWRRLKSGFWIRTRIPRCRPILHAIRAISTGLSS